MTREGPLAVPSPSRCWFAVREGLDIADSWRTLLLARSSLGPYGKRFLAVEIQL